ncbi:MAG: zinc transporter ZntB [Gammaproteobacteria bacterium]
MNDEFDGLVCGYLYADGGSWIPLGWPEIEKWTPNDGLLWVHLDLRSETTVKYLRETSKIDRLIQDALLAEETRPRTFTQEDGLLAIFRGVNLNPGADPEDMVSIRLWVEARRIISTRRRPLMAVQDMIQKLTSPRAPTTASDVFIQLSSLLIRRMSNVIETLDESTDELETEVIRGQSQDLRSSLTQIRQQSIALRRYLAPQRDAMSRLQNEELSWLDRRQKSRLRELTDTVIRYVEDLDAVRERAAIVQDELANRLTERMNKNMYLLTIVATVMLPLGFFTGLLGINVDGMPGAVDTPWAFGVVCAVLLLVAVAEILILRRLRWF